MVEVEIIIGVYNGEKFLRELIASLHAQTFAAWRAIFVDDGSSDSSPAILARAAYEDKRIRVITQKNAGVGAARNAALKEVTAEYVMFADQDDRLEKNAVERALEAIKASKADILHFHSNRGVGRSVFVWEHIFRVAALGDTRFVPITGGEDTAFFWELSFKLLKRAEIRDRLYYNRPNDGSFSRAVSAKYIDNAFIGYRAMGECARKNGLCGLRLGLRMLWHIVPFSASIMLRHFSWANLRALSRNLKKGW